MMAIEDHLDSEERLVRLTKVWLKGPVRAKEEAFHALMNFGHPKALSMVREVVTHRSSRLQDYAIDYHYAFSEALRDEYKAILDLNDEKWSKRCAATQLIRDLRSQSGKRALLSRYKSEKNAIVRRDIASSLGFWNDSKIVDFLRIALIRESDPSARIGCLSGLIRCGERDYITDYIATLGHEDSLVRQQAVNSLGNNVFHPDDRALVIDTLRDMYENEPHSGVRNGILTALKRLLSN